MKNVMNPIATQTGVTLLEVLVGFVIFTSSLVAVLNYVSEQIYHNHLSSANLHKVQMVYDYSTAIELDPEQLKAQSVRDDSVNFTVLASTMESSSQKGRDFLLNRYEYSVSDSSNAFAWAVIKGYQ